MLCSVAFNSGRMEGIRALAGDTTALRIVEEDKVLVKNGSSQRVEQRDGSVAAPLRSGHHPGHGHHEVLAGDSDGVDIQDEFLR